MSLIRLARVSNHINALANDIDVIYKNFSEDNTEASIQAVSKEVLGKVKENTPVKTGRLREANHLEQALKRNKFYIVNDTPYATIVHEDILRKNARKFSGVNEGPKFITRAVNEVLSRQKGFFEVWKEELEHRIIANVKNQR